MTIRISPGAVCAIGIVSAVGVAIVSDLRGSKAPGAEAAAIDPIVASFEREFDHEPGPDAKITRESIADDDLYRALNSLYWTAEDEAARATAQATKRNGNEDESD